MYAGVHTEAVYVKRLSDLDDASEYSVGQTADTKLRWTQQNTEFQCRKASEFVQYKPCKDEPSEVQSFAL